MTDLEHYISHYFGVNREELAELASHFKPTVLNKGDYFLKAGHQCHKLSFIRSGLIRIYASAGDKEVTQWISSTGYFVTDLSSLIFETPVRWHMQALSPCELYTIERRDYIALGKSIPKWHEIEKLFIAKCFSILEDRIFGFLSMTAEERYQMLFNNHRELFNQVPLQYLASMIGMTPETFSRIRKKSLGSDS